MLTPTPVNKIAAAYLGNPQPLAQKVEKDKQQNGGIPRDLRQLLALNDITQGRDAAGIQQALQIPTDMPTVAQSLQERARQAIQAQMMQQAQQQQQKEGLPMAIPPNTPRPPMQAQGIDSLPTNVGEGYAGGGIIGFSNGGDMGMPSLAEQDLANQAAELAAKERNAQTKAEKIAELQQKVNTLQYTAPELVPAINAQIKALSSSVSDQKPSPTDPNFRRLPDPRYTGTPAVSPSVPLITSGPSPSAAKVKPASTGDSAPMPAGLTDLAKLPSIGVGRDFLQRTLAENQKFDEEAFKQKYLKEVGAKDTSIYDEMAEELKARKERLNAPKQGYEALMEYLGQIAQSGGRNWMQSGAIGASRVNALQKERQTQQDALMEKILDLGAKKKEAQYGERLGMFTLTKAEKDKINKESTELAKALNLSEDKAEELRQNRLLEEAKMKNQLKVAGMGAQDNLMNRAAAIRRENPGMTVEESIRRAALAGGAASVGSTDARRDKAYIDAKNKIDERFQHLISDTPYGKKQKELYDKAISDLDKTFGVSGGGINTLPSAAQTIPAGAKPSDLNVGTVYQTARGPAKWNGKTFDPVQ